MLDEPTLDGLLARGRHLVKRFPGVEPWLSWWLLDDHASMLFNSARHMDADLWDSMPESNNAEESMHWRLYRAVEKKHDLMDGIYGVRAFLQHFERQIAARLSG